MSAAENGGGMSILFNYPKASEADFRDSPAFGHLLAPRGHIKVRGGNYNGSLVGHEVTSNGEGHLWPYRGGSLTSTSTEISAKK